MNILYTHTHYIYIYYIYTLYILYYIHYIYIYTLYIYIYYIYIYYIYILYIYTIYIQYILYYIHYIYIHYIYIYYIYIYTIYILYIYTIHIYTLYIYIHYIYILYTYIHYIYIILYIQFFFTVVDLGLFMQAQHRTHMSSRCHRQTQMSWFGLPQLFCTFGLLCSLWSETLATQSRLKVGYSCPGTSLDWIYDKFRSWNRFAEAAGFQHCQSLRGGSMVLQISVATVDRYKPQA